MDAKLNHSDLSSLLAKQAELSGTKAENFTKAFFDIITEGLEKDGIVKINGLGTFKVTNVASRGSVNVNTGEKIEIKGHKKLTFIPADALKDKINQPFAMFEPVEIDDSYVDEEDSANEENVNISDEFQTSEENFNDSQSVTESTNTQKEYANPVEKENNISTTQIEDVTENSVVKTEENKEERQIPKTYPLTEGFEKDSVPKKNKTPYIYILLTIIVVAILAIITPSVIVVLTGEKDSVKTEKLIAIKEKAIKKMALQSRPDTATTIVSQTTEAVVSLKDTVTKEQPYEFKMVEQLANKSVGTVGVGDTLLYTANGSIATHIVVENETLTRIALKYYGDKKLWPYIVQYNKLSNPNGLCKGMEILIPRLIPLD